METLRDVTPVQHPKDLPHCQVSRRFNRATLTDGLGKQLNKRLHGDVRSGQEMSGVC